MSDEGPAVLLVTHSGDYFTIDRVAEALRRRGARPFRLNTDRFPASVRLAAWEKTERLPGSRAIVEAEEGEVELASVRAVWMRRTWAPAFADDLDPRFREACAREAAAALEGVLTFCDRPDVRWINPPGVNARAENKLRQLRIAQAVGLEVPRTLVTNDPARVREFHEALQGAPGGPSGMIAKMLTPLAVSMDRSAAAVRTSLVEPEDLEHLDQLRHSPLVFQELVPKALELRIACVAGELFAGAIDASGSRAGAVDWRGATPNEVGWTLGDVPPEVARSLRALLERLGLVYGAVDMIRTPDGRHVFLEVNPGGEWGMLERDLELPIADALARTLLAAPESER